ncbi:MAG TPA: hypothetical protein VIS74_04785 [Chthoniobacterales bacterium]
MEINELARTLLSSSQSIYFKENARISSFLQAHPNSGQGHLQATFLLGTIALNDYSGDFRDIRIPLNRMIAHLAAADALGVPRDHPNRQFVEVLRLTLCGQQADALAALKTWKPPQGFEAILADWQEIFRLRNTQDWRESRSAALHGSPALKREYFRALVKAINATAGLDFLREAKIQPDPALWRIANESSLSVSDGHTFSKPILEVEFEETAEAAREFGIKPSKDDLSWLKDYLDAPEGSPVLMENGKPVIQVAGKNLFAGYSQRNLMQGLNSLFTFLNDQWGVTDQASGLEEFIKQKLPELKYKPFLIRMIARDNPARISANAVCTALIHDQPSMVTPALWSSLRTDQDGNDLHLSFPDFHSWFHPEVPYGTAFESGSRLYKIGVGDENNDAWMKTLWERAPYSYPIALQNAYLENDRSFANLSAEILGKWAGPLADYNLQVMRRLADCDEGQPALYAEAMEKAAKLDPNCYLILGNYLVGQDLPEKAAEAYLKAFEQATDRVWMANRSKWLVKYLFEKGGVEMANKVAADAADVYSYNGLEAFIWLKEREGKWEEALETARKIDKRYEDDQPVNESACLFRMYEVLPDMAIALGYEDKVKKVFPEGARKVLLKHFSSAPIRGVLISGSSQAMVPFGLRKGYVIVALNGYQTDTFDQYTAIRLLSDDPRMSLIVWDGSKYRVCEGDLPSRRFRVEMKDFAAK